MSDVNSGAPGLNKTESVPEENRKNSPPTSLKPKVLIPHSPDENKKEPQPISPDEPQQQSNFHRESASLLRIKSLKKLKEGTLRQWGASLIITFSFFIVGMALGWPSPVLYKIREKGIPLNMTDLEKSVMVTFFYAGNIVMPIPGGMLGDLMGRKTSLLVMSALPLSSWILIYFPIHPAMLYVARLFAGMWSGVAQTIVPMYIGEIVESQNRGKISALSQIYINCGVVLVYFIGREVSYSALAIICGVMPVLFILCLLFIPESPYWLHYTGSPDRADKSLIWYRGGNTNLEKAGIAEGVKAEDSYIARSVKSDMNKPQGWQMLFKVKGYRVAMMIIQALSVGQRLTGISAVMAYCSITLPDMPVWLLSPNDCVTIIGISWLLGCATNMALVDKVGRIPLLLASSSASALGMLTVFVWFFIHRSTTEYSVHWLPFLALFWYGWWFNLGIGPVPTTLQGEMFPSHLKASANGITSMVLSCTSVLVNSTYLLIARAYGMYVNYAVFTLTCVGIFIFTWFCVIETKGKTLREIQQELKAIN